ncbi:MAG: hypothetical protein R3E66_16835 [bacterium]
MMRHKLYRWSVIAGVLSLCATLFWFFFGDRFAVIRSSGNDTFSVSALGHQALLRNLDAAGMSYHVSTYKTAGPAQDAGLVVSIEPYLSSTNAITLEAFREFLGTETPLLVALPKRWGSPPDAKSPHISRHGLESLKDVHWAVDEIQTGIRLRRFASATCTTGDGKSFVLEDAQLLQTDWGEPVISCDHGVLVARTPRTWMVFDPDIFSNFRQDEPIIADVSRTVLRDAADGRRIVFDETAHGHIKPPTIGRFLTSWPMGALTAHLFCLFALLVWFASVPRTSQGRAAGPTAWQSREIANAADLMYTVATPAT